jgi:plastocyanin
MNGRYVRLVSAIATLCASFATNAGNISATIIDGKGQPLPDAIVYLVPSQPLLPVKSKHVVIDQVDKEFVPRVTVVQTGTAVDFPNHDNIRHQVYSFSPAKTFQLKLYSGRPSSPVIFDRSGLAVLGCNIHDHMIAWVLSVDTPWFARTDAQGRAQVSDMPAGKYEMLVWHPGMAQPLSQGQIDTTGDAIQRSIKVETGALVGATMFDDEPGFDDDHPVAHHEHPAAGS